MITKITIKDFNEIYNDCVLSKRNIVSVFPYFAYNLTKDDSFKVDINEETDEIIFLFDIENQPLKLIYSPMDFRAKWKNFLTINDL